MSRSWTSPILDLQRRLDELFEEVIYRRWAISSSGVLAGGREWVPAIDLHELADGFLIEADLPGLSPDQVRIEISPQVLTITGNRVDAIPEGVVASRRERPFGPFRRTLDLPVAIDVTGVKAVFHHGLVRIFAPKARQAEEGLRPASGPPDHGPEQREA